MAFIVALFLAFSGNHNRVFSHETPLQILKRRFASGEISKEQFEEMKKMLS
ncbi:MAG TPA: SHOCT domain-containing protein [Bacteroidia bacterium]|nr:SHOCT domain-containing protein [Bacteroidia bacterium]